MTSDVAFGFTEHCFTTVQHEGTALGKTTSIADVSTYVTGSPESKRIILFFSDIYGPFYINNQLLMDYFASMGFLVLGLDYFFGDPVHKAMAAEGFSRDAWTAKAGAQSGEAAPKWIKAVKETYAGAKFCAVGYCFGGPFVMDLAATDDIVAGAVAHPTRLTDEHFRAVKRPVFFSCAETDRAFPAEARRKAEDILVELKAKYTFQVFSGVDHGFAVRGDPNNGDTRWAKEESARSIIGWFSRFSGGN